MLEANHITKSYGAVQALTDGHLQVNSGEVLALLGANGSGKSTLGKVITGVVAPTSGELKLDGQPVSFASPYAARQQGITAVYQELSLIPDMTVAENIFLGHEPLGALGQVRSKVMKRDAEGLLELFAGTMHATPDDLVMNLGPSERQLVEILKAISQQPRLLILDEATASLDSQQVDRLFELVAQWKSEGMAIITVTHRMDEIFRTSDRAVVLRNGDTVGSATIAESDEASLVTMMIGDAAAPERASTTSLGDVTLTVNGLTTRKLDGINLSVRAGELLGLGGLQGQGQEDVLSALFGALPFTGEVVLEDDAVHFNHPKEAMNAGLAYVPGDRGNEGLLMIRSILENLQLPSWTKYGWPIKQANAWQDGTNVADQLSLKMDSLAAPVSSLSGGNAQKVVIGKWLLRQPKVLLLNDPTKGIDVGSKAEFYALLNQLRQEGTAILFYSSDDEELLGLCDRVLVLQDGRVSAELAGEMLTRAGLVAASMGSEVAA
ncbi:MAG: sugar ABC transporter ATP-binding protein [Deinococcota bacterium]